MAQSTNRVYLDAHLCEDGIYRVDPIETYVHEFTWEEGRFVDFVETRTIIDEYINYISGLINNSDPDY